MSLVTQLQPVLTLATVLAAPVTSASSTTVLGTLSTVLSDQSEHSVSLINTGLMGPPGPPGPPGPSGEDRYYRHDQGAASNFWVVNHNFGKRPLVGVFNSGGQEVWAEIIHASDNQALIYFDNPITGYAICS